VNQGRKAKIIFRIVAAIIIVAFIFMLLPLVVYRDWAFMCENTASRKGYREWFWGTQTGQWYKQSAVEKFMLEKFPQDLKHRWTSYAGTGHNIFGTTVLYGHARPGAIKYVDQDFLNEWFTPLNDAEKKQFYDLLLSDDQEAIKQKVLSISDKIVERHTK
jgi:hypothetical protein